MTERLTTAQKARVRKAYREAFSAADQVRAVNKCYATFVDLYGVSIDTLRLIIEEDRQRHEAEYRALQAIRGGAHQEPRNVKYCPVCLARVGGLEKVPTHKDAKGFRCVGSGYEAISKAAAKRRRNRKDESIRSTSVRAVSGGLPTLGRRR